MIEELATVTQIQSGIVTVESHIKSTCSQCQQVDNCGSGLVAKAIPHKKLSLDIQTDLTLSMGDNVVLAIPEDFLLRSAWQVYLWPIFGLILFAGLGQVLLNNGIFSHELFVIALAGIGGVLGQQSVIFWQKITGQNKLLQPVILRVIPQELNV